MCGVARRAGMVAIACSIWALPADAIAVGLVIRLAQNAPDTGAADPNRSATLPANSLEQIRKAQVELRRLDCLKGRIDGKLGDQTREAVRKFWTSAKQPVAEVNITEELISQLAVRGDNFCRPVRRFFGFGGRSGGNPAALPFFAPGARQGGPATTAPPASDAPREDLPGAK